MINDRPCYDRPDGKGYERIWFPEGNQTEGIRMEASSSLLPKDTEAEPEKYTSDVCKFHCLGLAYTLVDDRY